MRIRLLPSAPPGTPHVQFATSYVIDEKVAVDAGSIGFQLDIAGQARIRHVFVTHSHADHIASLPVFVDNAREEPGDCITIWGNEQVLQCIREDIFNDRFYPDYLALSASDEPLLKIEELRAEVPVAVEGLEILPVPVDHLVTTFGLVVRSADAAVVIASDTAPTTRIWEVARELPELKAVFLEASFPDRMREVAEVSGHLTPEMFGKEIAKLGRNVPIIAVHLKPRYVEEISAQLAALALPDVEVAVPGRAYEF